MGRDVILECRDFAVARPESGFTVRVAELEVGAGQVACLLGPSGCGKTALLLGLLGLDPDLRRTGRAVVEGRPLPAPGSEEARRWLFERVTCVLQDARAALDPTERLLDQMRQATRAGPRDCAAALEELGVRDAAALVRRFPHQVSGGQAQRVLLAIARLRRPRLLVADEPTASLDAARREDLVASLGELTSGGTAILAATHDDDFVAACGARALPYVAAEGAFVPRVLERPAWPRSPETRGREAVVLACEGIGVRYGRKWVLRGVDLEVRAGESRALVGPSGAGKTTLARVLAGLQSPSEGRVHRPPGRASVQMLFQDAYASLTPHLTLGRQVRETAAPGFDVRAEAAALGLTERHLERLPRELSGGERRRGALLRALSVRPRVLLLDEPTASLDRGTGVEVVRSLLALGVERRLAMLWITHDLDLAEAVAGRERTLRLEEPPEGSW